MSNLIQPSTLHISDFVEETESTEYEACRFQLNGRGIVCRKAKLTPKKVGQFVTFWKRQGTGPIEPFSDQDELDFFIVNVSTATRTGLFVFPRTVLLEKGILSKANKEGKRGFRVYPPWDKVESKQAIQTQKWQLSCFYEKDDSINWAVLERLFK
ncbi:MAG: MepB family protein [Bacteroidetes bacterium]|nr:MAG: MepB family protein [Bacteroidota bacterium]